MNTILSHIKKYTAFGAVALAAMTYTGCTNLDENPYTFIAPDQFYKTESDVDAALNNAYHAFRNIAASSRNYVTPIEVLTDQGEANYRKESQHHYRNTWSDMENINNTFSDLWSKSYVAINDANIVIGRADGVSMSDENRNRLKGQALFLRAYAFYHLVRIYGGCPIPTTYTAGISGLKTARESADKVWEQIFIDLQEAAEMLPKRGTAGYDVWRVTSGSCYALLGEAYLYKATISNEDNFSANKEELELSKKYSKMVIDQNAYSLMGDYTNLWYWFNQGAKNNSESVFELQFYNGEGGHNGMGIDFGPYGGLKKNGKVVAGAYYCRFGPTVDLYRSYNDNDRRRDVLLTQFTDKQDVVWTYDMTDEYWKNAAGDPFLIEGSRAYSFMCLLNAKYYDPWADNDLYGSYPAANFPMLRYAEVLLNYAEAANLLKAGDGLAELNQVHQRAGLPALSSMGQKEMDEAILQERLWEFPGECKAYYDELRKGVLGDRKEEQAWRSYSIYKQNIQLRAGNANSREKVFFPYPMTNKPTKSWLWKIPSSDISSNSLLEQNPENKNAALKYNWQ